MEQKQKSKKKQILNDHDIKILKDGLLTDNHMLKANTILMNNNICVFYN